MRRNPRGLPCLSWGMRPLVLVMSLAAAPALAQPAPPRPDTRATLSLGVENDLFGGGTDRYYSNGLLLALGSASADLPAPLAWLDRQLDGLQGPGVLRWGASLNHAIFTPQDIRAAVPDPRDRPYAGLLLGSFSLHRVTAASLSTVEIQAGILGPAAGGEFVQNNWHGLIGVRKAQGWSAQIPNTPVANLALDRRWRAPLGRLGGLEAEAVPNVTLVAGNLNIHAAAGGILRLGQGLEGDFGPPRIRPSLAGSAFFQPPADRPYDALGWYAFAGAEARGVAHDLTLVGRGANRGVDARPLVMDLTAGAALTWRGVRLSYTQVWRTEEFYGQRGGMQVFGSVNLSFRF